MTNFGASNETEPNLSVYLNLFNRINNSADHSGELDLPDSKNKRGAVQ